MILAILLVLATEPQLPSGTTCDQIKSLVAEHGKVKALAWAFEHGLSIRQIYLIRKTCKV
jgi:hypothetical protein